MLQYSIGKVPVLFSTPNIISIIGGLNFVNSLLLKVEAQGTWKLEPRRNMFSHEDMGI